jgi:cellulose synthase/poly-beta-1,6-N-acetylglucosamine synthase-like glycosyltransferase
VETLIGHFGLTRLPYQIEYAIPCRPIRGVYRSAEYPSLVVVDKENGGKADALNAGINVANFPLVCAIDADSVLESNALSIASVLLDELSFRRFPRASQLCWLILYGFIENFGYRQLTTWWRARAFVDYWRGNKTWGKMERKGFTRPKV